VNLPKELRLKSFEVLLLKTKYPDKSATSSYLKLKFYSNETTKFTFIVGKKFLSKSTDRNFLRRHIKATLYKKYTSLELLKGHYVFIVKDTLKKEDLTNEKISFEINKVLSKIS